MLYVVGKKLFLFLFKYLARWQVSGQENIPKEGPVILAANHTSYWDPIVVAVASPRKVRFMAKKELFDIFLLGTIIKKLYAIPVDRNKSDRVAIRNALKILEEGDVFGIFPEGRRVRDGSLGEFKHGVALIGLRSGAPIVPVALKNTPNIIKRGWFRSFEVKIGEPLTYPELKDKKISSDEIRKVTADIRNSIKKMLNDD